MLDCQKLTGKQGTCHVFGEGAAAHAECAVSDECATADEPSERHCSGDLLRHCDGPGVGFGIDCSALGLDCVEQGQGRAECVLPREPETCDSPGTGSCDGATIRFCGDDGVAYERDCALLGDMVCGEGTGDRIEDTPWFDCVAKGCETRFEAADRCDGDDLVLHIGQDDAGVRVACTDYGFAGCQNDPLFGEDRCVP